ncbi:MAG: ankyrin repeat domain-containing protein [Spirochaetia bacterium]|nr:ankyrin repeat domain-containing protein [Spirochaetia bacterium]
MRKIITLSFAIFLCLTASLFAADMPTEMNTAIATGDIAKVKALLDGGFDPNTALPNGQSPAMAAANAGNAEIVSLLIKAGADVSLVADNQLGGNALTGAVWSTQDTHDPANTIKIIQILLDAGIDINSGETRDESSDYKAGGKTWETYINPVWYVIGGNNCSADVLEFMLDKGCDPSRGFAISESDERHDFDLDDTISAVKKSKTNKNDKKEYNKIVKILKDSEKKKEPKPEPKPAVAAPAPVETPAPATAAPAQTTAAPAPAPAPVSAAPAPAAKPEPKPAPKPVAKPVVKKPTPAPKSAKTEAVPEKTTAILTKEEATEMLRKSVTDGNKVNFYHSLVMGADINAVDPENKTPLVQAVMSNNHEMAEVLIYKGANVNVRTNGGNTPLSMARDLGAKDIEQMLLKAGAKE